MLPLLRELTDQYGVRKPPAARSGSAPVSTYVAELHAELVRGLARHLDAADEPRLTAALRHTPPTVLVEALHAWAASRRGRLPAEAADLRSHGDWRVRAAALQALVAQRHPQARQFLSEALRDTDLQVRLAAIAGLGALGDPAVASHAQEPGQRSR